VETDVVRGIGTVAASLVSGLVVINAGRGAWEMAVGGVILVVGIVVALATL
jgi:hypothetical protein